MGPIQSGAPSYTLSSHNVYLNPNPPPAPLSITASFAAHRGVAAGWEEGGGGGPDSAPGGDGPRRRRRSPGGPRPRRCGVKKKAAVSNAVKKTIAVKNGAIKTAQDRPRKTRNSRSSRTDHVLRRTWNWSRMA